MFGGGIYWLYWTKDVEASRQEEKRRERKFMDGVKEGMQRADVTEGDARHRVRCRQMICCGDP